MKNSPFNGALLWTIFLGLFILMMVIVASGFQETLHFAPYRAGYGTLAMVLVLIAGSCYPEILRWTETTLQNLWGGGGGDENTQVSETEQEPTWPQVLRSMAYAVCFLNCVFIFGFAVIPPLFIILYLVVEAGVRPIWAILAALITTAILLSGMVILHVEVWAGILPEIIEGYLGGSIIPPV